MVPRPLYRWKSFYAGIFVLGSIALSWARSISYLELLLLRIPSGNKVFVLGQSSGCFFVDYCDKSYPGGYAVFGSGGSILELRRDPLGHPSLGFPQILDGFHFPLGWGVEVAHWFVILLFAGVWGVFLIRRGRRHKELEARISASSVHAVEIQS